MFCTKCGAELKQGANYCIQCGSPVKNADNIPDDEENEIKKLEDYYQSLLSEKEEKDKKIQIVQDIKGLHKEIDELLKSAEKQEYAPKTNV